MKLTPYLLFDGNCKEAMEFYHACLGGELTLTKVKDTPAKDQMPSIQHEKVLNARLSAGQLEISASDWLVPKSSPDFGNNVSAYLSGGTLPELKPLFEKLSDGANVIHPLQPTFFGSYGALCDRYGVRWMFAGNRPESNEA